MTKEIVEKKKMNLFELMDRVFENERKRMNQIQDQLNRSIFGMYDIVKNPIIKIGTIDDFQKSIEEFKKANPNAKITARAYTFSSEEPEKNKIFEYTEESKKLPEKKKKSKKK